LSTLNQKVSNENRRAISSNSLLNTHHGRVAIPCLLFLDSGQCFAYPYIKLRSVCVCVTCPAEPDSFGAYAPWIVALLPSSAGVNVYGLVHKETEWVHTTYMKPLEIAQTSVKFAPRTFNKLRNRPWLLLVGERRGERSAAYRCTCTGQ
jgi:hypothetical protein